MTFKYCGSLAKLTCRKPIRLTTHPEENLYATVEEVIRYVEKKFGGTDTVSGMTKLLHRLNSVSKKSKEVPGKADTKAQEEFVRDYAKLRKKAISSILPMDPLPVAIR